MRTGLDVVGGSQNHLKIIVTFVIFLFSHPPSPRSFSSYVESITRSGTHMQSELAPDKCDNRWLHALHFLLVSFENDLCQELWWESAFFFQPSLRLSYHSPCEMSLTDGKNREEKRGSIHCIVLFSSSISFLGKEGREVSMLGENTDTHLVTFVRLFW